MSSDSAQSLEQLQQEITRLMALVNQHEDTIKDLQHRLHILLTAKFGSKTEKGIVDPVADQFDEAELTPESTDDELDVPDADEETETITYTRTKNKTGRKPLPKSLPYIEKLYDLSDSEKQCPCGCTLTHIKDEITEQLDVVPQMTFRVVHIRKQYACKNCEETISLAKLPKQPIDKSIAAPGLLAVIIDSKFNRHMPLYRQEAMFAEANISVTRGTLSSWLIKSATLLTPLVKLMEADIQNYDIAYADETPLQVLKEKDRLAKQKSYVWLFIGGAADKRAFVYQYHTTRSHQIPFDFFADFKGYLHADCYKAYIQLGQQEHIEHVACWAHARRYFVDVARASKKAGLAHQFIKLIGKLYHCIATIRIAFNGQHKITKKFHFYARKIIL